MTLRQIEISGPLGPMCLLSNSKTLLGLRFDAPRGASAEKLEPWEKELIELICLHLQGKRVSYPDFGPLPEESHFARKVFLALAKVPWGSTISYQELAIKAGHPMAARAVGQVMAANRLPLLRPCHRVLPKAGGLGNYSARGGWATKAWLLAREGINIQLLTGNDESTY